MNPRSLAVRIIGRTNYDAFRIVRDARRHDPAEPARRGLYSRWLKPGALAFDIGANHGSRTRVFAQLGARVVAVEPQPHCARALRWLFGWRTNVKVVAAAAGADHIPKQITQFETDELSSLQPAWIDAARQSGRFGDLIKVREVTVPCVTLDQLVAAHGKPAFIKIDVEGYEPEVLAGLSQAAGTISFEFTPELPAPALVCVDRLAALGYRRFQFSAGESMQLHEDWLDVSSIRAVISAMRQTAGPFGDVYALDPSLSD